MTRRIHSARSIAALFALLLMPGPSQLSAQARRMTIPEMTAAAGTIILGTVMESRGALDEQGDPVTYTTFRVEQTIKGKFAGTLTIKQYGGITPTVSMLLNHMRYFKTGERVLVMLYAPSRRGFSSPVGMEQGVWSVENGQVQRVAEHLLGGMSATMARHSVAPVPMQSIPTGTFVSMIRETMSKGRNGR